MSGRTIYLRKLEKEGMEKRKGCNIPRGEPAGEGMGEKRRAVCPRELVQEGIREKEKAVVSFRINQG